MEKTRLKLYNTLTRKKELFRPLHKRWVGLYTCGPTVYNFTHIGNLRTYIFEDILRRTLEYTGYKVRHVMNITDVEDKIIRDAKKAGKTIFKFVKPYERAFFDDLKKLNIKKAWKYPRATKHIREMAALIEKLLKKGLAYKADGSVYFDISKFKNYGRLSRVKARELKAGARVDVDEYSKKDVQDFVLWKEKRAGEPSWKAPFGEGRPGWHIECSAMSLKYLGPTLDLHTGAVDNIFPHHENEIAQSEGATGKKFVRFFVEGEHLLVDGEKMAKSRGNVFTLRNIEAKGFSPLAFRYLILTSHYRSKLNFTWKSLEAAQNSLERLRAFIRALRAPQLVVSLAYNKPREARLTASGRRFTHAIDNDLNTPKALAIVWDLIRNYNKSPHQFNAGTVLGMLYDFDQVLGLGLTTIKRGEAVPQKIQALVKRRESFRKKKLWKEADKIRSEIKKLGYLIEDTPTGPQIKKQ